MDISNITKEQITALAEIAIKTGSEFNVTYGKDGSVSVSISTSSNATENKQFNSEESDSRKCSKRLSKNTNKKDTMYVTPDLQFVKNCNIVSERMTERRKALGITQLEIAKRCEVPAATISQIHKDAKSISVKNLFKIAEALDCTIEYLLDMTTTPNPPKLVLKDEFEPPEVIPSGFKNTLALEHLSEETVGDRIRSRRMRIGWSQSDLAKRLGVKVRSNISLVERGGTEPGMDSIRRYAKALMCTEKYLLGYEEDTSPIPEFKRPEAAKKAIDDPSYAKIDENTHVYLEASTVTLSPEFFATNKLPWKSSLMVSGQGTEPNSKIDVTVVSQDKNLTPGDRIKYRRKSLKISQDEIAKRLNIRNRSSISRYESIGKRIKMGTLDQFAHVLDCPAIYFMGITKTTANTDDKGHIVSIDLPEFAAEDTEFFKHL